MRYNMPKVTLRQTDSARAGHLLTPNSVMMFSPTTSVPAQDGIVAQATLTELWVGPGQVRVLSQSPPGLLSR